MNMESAPLITMVIKIAYARGSLFSLELNIKTVIKLIIRSVINKFFIEKNELLFIEFHLDFIFNIFYVKILLLVF